MNTRKVHANIVMPSIYLSIAPRFLPILFAIYFIHLDFSQFCCPHLCHICVIYFIHLDFLQFCYVHNLISHSKFHKYPSRTLSIFVSSKTSLVDFWTICPYLPRCHQFNLIHLNFLQFCCLQTDSHICSPSLSYIFIHPELSQFCVSSKTSSEPSVHICLDATNLIHHLHLSAATSVSNFHKNSMNFFCITVGAKCI